MGSGDDRHRGQRARKTTILRPAVWRPADRHILLGVSHPSDDPARHRVFEVRAVFDHDAGGWIAEVGEQNLNEQRGAWEALPSPEGVPRVFPTAATCLGAAVTTLIDTVDREADEES
jgi:hypothetical protein